MPIATASSDILEKIEKWKENPLINPYDDTEIELSVNPKSEYVKLYKKFIEIEIKHIMDKNKAGYKLTIKDCKKIKDSLPDEHAKIKVDGKDDIFYDHLFIKYFIKKEKKYKYDAEYKKDLDIYLYLNVYDSLIKKLKLLPPLITPETPVIQKKSSSDSFRKVGEEYSVIEDLLKNNININKADFSIGKLIERLCRDIKKLLYANKFKMTEKDYIIVLDNIKILNYASSIYELCEVKDLRINKNNMVENFINLFKDKNKLNPKNDNHYIDDIFLEIIILLIKYEDVDEDVDKFAYVYTLDEKNYTDLELLERRSYEEIFIILQKIYVNICNLYAITININYDIVSTLSEEEKEKFKTNKYKYKYIGTADDSADDSADIKGKALDKELKKICKDDWMDSVSLRDLTELSYNEKKHMTYIKRKINKRTLTFCNDTISIYNQIITNTNKNKPPFIASTKEELTLDEIVQICNKLSKLTKDPKHILEAELIKIKYANNAKIHTDLLILQMTDDYYVLKKEDKVGIIGIHLCINLYDTLKFPLVTKGSKDNFPDLYDIENSGIIQLPLFTDEQKKNYITTLIYTLKDIVLKTNKILYNTSFPYRKPNLEGGEWDSILTLPEFKFDTTEDPDKLYESAKLYKKTLKNL